MTDALSRAVDALTTQARRIADALTTTPDDAQRRVEQAEAVTAETKRLMERRTTTLRRRAETAETELRVLRAGVRANGGDPTTVQNLWAQIRLRNRQWREAKRELCLTRSLLEEEGGDVALVDEMIATVAKAEREAREAQAAIDRVHTLVQNYEQWAAGGWQPSTIAPSDVAREFRAALNGPEQPGTGGD